jgi:polyisoprenoid-binding protein YceI
LLATLLVAAPALGQEARQYTVKAADSTLRYRVIHKLHEVLGTARPSEGRGRLLPDGTLQVAVRANVADFDSGNANRDAHMKEATEAAKYPTVEFKGVATGVKVPESFPAKLAVVLKGQLTFHGVKQPVVVPMEVVFESAREVVATGSFGFSLEAFQVERPALLMVKVDDAAVMETQFKLEQVEAGK